VSSSRAGVFKVLWAWHAGLCRSLAAYPEHSPFKKHWTIRRSPTRRFDQELRLMGNSDRLTDSLTGDTISPGKSLRRISIEPGACSQISGQSAVTFNCVRVDVVTVTSISYIVFQKLGGSATIADAANRVTVTVRTARRRGKAAGRHW